MSNTYEGGLKKRPRNPFFSAGKLMVTDNPRIKRVFVSYLMLHARLTVKIHETTLGTPMVKNNGSLRIICEIFKKSTRQIHHPWWEVRLLSFWMLLSAVALLANFYSVNSFFNEYLRFNLSRNFWPRIEKPKGSRFRQIIVILGWDTPKRNNAFDRRRIPCSRVPNTRLDSNFVTYGLSWNVKRIFMQIMVFI